MLWTGIGTRPYDGTLRALEAGRAPLPAVLVELGLRVPEVRKPPRKGIVVE